MIAVAVLATLSLVECPKCDSRFRIAADGRTATVNLSRLRDDMPDAATLKRRTAAMVERASRYLRRSQVAATGDVRSPIMGWSTWNTFGADISESLILETARAMATNGLKAAGYLYVNIDDGFFSGHDDAGRLRFHPRRFPNGLKGTVDGIHALGLRAGIYSDAGADTCGFIYGAGATVGKDQGGRGSGLYGHDIADCQLHFGELGFDFFKVDYCGGIALKLDERRRYTEIAEAIRATGRTDVRYNLCRWAFPGTWAAEIADSWRTTEDIRASWKSVSKIVRENLYLSAYASSGHFNDMDMLEVGHRKGRTKTEFGKNGDVGLTEDEEVAHFGMWCMMSSPLLIGCDARAVPQQTLDLVTNPYLIQMNQNCGLGVQGYVASRQGESYVLVKDADVRFGRLRYVALYNAEDTAHEFMVCSKDLDLGGTVNAFDLVERKDVGEFVDHVFVKVPSHGARFFLFDAEQRLERTTYEAETAYLPAYQELEEPLGAGSAFPHESSAASGGVAVRNLGRSKTNGLVWKDVNIVHAGDRRIDIVCASSVDSWFILEAGGAKERVRVPATKGIWTTVSVPVRLDAGTQEIRLTNGESPMPDVDVMRLR